MSAPARQPRYYEFVMVAFVTILVCSNLIGPAKISQVDLPLVGVLTFGAGVLFFPISYVFGDILTEVYGYARSRRVIWAGFAALGFASFVAWAVVALPPAPFWKNQAAYEVAFGSAWRVALASMIAYFCGEFVNSFVLAKMKVWMHGRRLWMRTIGSTLFGEGVDSLLFYPLAFRRDAAKGDGGAVRRQGDGGGSVHAVHLRDRGVAQARGAGGPLRSRYALYTVLPQGLKVFGTADERR
jgi:hypothetical protein